MNSEPLMRVDRVSISYRLSSPLYQPSEVKPVFTDLSFSLNKGDGLGIVGANGSGKSTLLRVACRLLRPTQGEVIWRENISYSLLAFGAGLMDDLTGYDNIRFGALLRGVTPAQVPEVVEEVSSFCELGRSLYQPVKTYSSGMRARLNFGLAVAASADVLFIDEVLSVGDGRFRSKAKLFLEDRLWNRHGFVLVTHNMGQLKELCNRAILIQDGGVKMDADVESVIEQYSADMATTS